jgi:hypothetical protein
MFTDEQQRIAEADAGQRIASERYPGRALCRGYPAEHYCIVLIPAFKWPQLCRSCLRSRDLDREAAFHREVAESVDSILGRIDVPDAPVKMCACGGDSEATYHEASLLHQTWVARGKT